MAPLPEGPDDALHKFEQQAFPKPLAKSAGVVVSHAKKLAPTKHMVRPRAAFPPPGMGALHHGALAGDENTDATMGRRPAGLPDWTAGLAMPDIPVRWSDKLLTYLDFYRSDPKGRAIMTHWLRQMGRYGPMITQKLRAHQLPQALLYVAMIESSYDPSRTSPAGAVGMWQFMLSTGQGYGLHRDHWIDERRNPELSTEAALKFLKNLYDRLGRWELALAAYNAGFGTVIDAIRKYNTNDFWQLCEYEAGLPWETTFYVPKILAAAIVGFNLEAFGFDDVEPYPPRKHELVFVSASLKYADIAEAVGADEDQIATLNPELRRSRTPPNAGIWIRIPPRTADRFYAYLARRLGNRARLRPYDVRLGDTLDSIAERFCTSPRALRRRNKIHSELEVRPGVTLLVPAKTPAAGRCPRVQKAPADEEQPTIVAVPAEIPAEMPGRRRVFYRVVLGDTLGEIAGHMDVTVAELAGWNQLDVAATLVSGMVLQVFVAESFNSDRVVLLDPTSVTVVEAGSDQFLDLHEKRKGRRRLVYTIKEGDTLSGLSERYAISVSSLMRINRFPQDVTLKVGDKVVIYVDPEAVHLAARRRAAAKRRAAARAARKKRALRRSRRSGS